MPTYVLDARTATPHFPGIGRYARNLAQALSPLLRMGERLIVLQAASHPFPLPEHARVQVVPVNVSPFNLHQQIVIPRLLRRLNADLYHSTYYLMPYWPGVPTVLTVYDLIPLRFSEAVSLRARFAFHLTTRLALRTSVHQIAISEATRQDYQQQFHLPGAQISSIPLAADPRFRPTEPSEIEAVRHRFGLPMHYVLYVGSNKPHKNLERLVEAWGQVVKSMGDAWVLVIAGGWLPNNQRPLERARELHLLPFIRWLGPIDDDDLPALYSGAGVFVFPSRYEGFGLPALEAMTCGTPVACSNISSLPEVCGPAAAYFDPERQDSIANTLLHLLQSPNERDRLRRLGLEQAHRFSWRATAERTLMLYRQLC